MTDATPSQRKVALRRSFPFVRVMFVLIVVLPTALALTYALQTEAPLYRSQAQFAIEDRQQGSNAGLTGLIASIGVASGEPNSIYTLRRFIQSGDALAELEAGYGFSEYYAAPNGDWLTRLHNTDSSDSVLRYYTRMVKPKVSTTENIVTLEVSAFDPETARDISANLLAIFERFVNQINTQAIQDQVSFHESEVEKAQARLLEARTTLTSWRNENGAFNPMSQAETLQGLIASLELDLATINSDISLLEGADSPERFAPRVRALEDQKEVLLGQLANARDRLAGPSASTLSLKIDEFERLVAQVEFADRSLEISLSSLETARQVALQQQKYLLLISNPSLPSERVFPRPEFHTFVVFVAALLAFGVVVLLRTIIRDYRSV